MDTIIAGRFETWEKAEAAAQILFNDFNVNQQHVCTFYVGPPGHHATYPIGGDQDVDSATEPAPEKGTAASIIGAGIAGAAALPAGPLAAATAAAVGAYTGSLVGSLKGMKDEDDPQSGNSANRAAGVMVAVKVNPESQEAEDVLRGLRQAGAQDIEKTEGQWSNGQWFDFDPVAPPKLVDRATP